MIKIETKEVIKGRVEQCRCCGEFFYFGVLYEIKIAPMDETTKEMQCGATTIQFCKNCIEELKNNLKGEMK